jgi:hypothetical protein
MPKGSASRRILSMYFIGSLNSFSVGLKTGASTWTRRNTTFFSSSLTLTQNMRLS